MKIISFSLLSIILLGLAILHFYWATGGKWRLEKSIPIKANGNRLFYPKMWETLIIGVVLFIFGIYYLLRLNFIMYHFPNWIIKYGDWVIPIIFILRAVGDFKYIGFFKRIKNTNFAQSDTQIYSPLCLVIGFLGLIIQIL